MTQELLIVGTSARAAAQSARRAGRRPIAIDQFTDEDLLTCCPAKRVEDYPHGIAALASQFPRCPFMYTGAMENHPEVITVLARDRPLLGNNAEIVRVVRNPWTLHEKLIERRLSTPEIRRADESLPSGTWLSKPFRSGGGMGIRRIENLTDGPSVTGSSAKTHYRQRFVPGEPISALYIAARGESALLGVTRQLVGCTWAGADHFLYVGNVGPLVVPSVVVQQLQQVGDMLAQDFQLVGLFGIDAILRGDDLLTLEVNPRFTASVEILERSLELPAIHLHLEACEHNRLLTKIVPNGDRIPHGKAILYARCSVVIPREFSQWVATLRRSDTRYPVIADLPAAGTSIVCGGAVCTIFASAPTETAALKSLKELAREVYAVVEVRRS